MENELKICPKWQAWMQERFAAQYTRKSARDKAESLIYTILAAQEGDGATIGKRDWTYLHKRGVEIPSSYFIGYFGGNNGASKFLRAAQAAQILESDGSYAAANIEEHTGRTWCKVWRVNYQPLTPRKAWVSVDALTPLKDRIRALEGHTWDFGDGHHVSLDIAAICMDIDRRAIGIRDIMALVALARKNGRNEKGCREYNAFALASKDLRKYFCTLDGEGFAELIDLPGAQFFTVPLGAAILNRKVATDGYFAAYADGAIMGALEGNTAMDPYRRIYDAMLDIEPDCNLFAGLKAGGKGIRNRIKRWAMLAGNAPLDYIARCKALKAAYIARCKAGDPATDRTAMRRERDARGVLLCLAAIRRAYPIYGRIVDAMRHERGATFRVQTLGEMAIMGAMRKVAVRRWDCPVIRVHDALYAPASRCTPQARKALAAMIARTFGGDKAGRAGIEATANGGAITPEHRALALDWVRKANAKRQATAPNAAKAPTDTPQAKIARIRAALADYERANRVAVYTGKPRALDTATANLAADVRMICG